jgi:hypothetical protein
MRGIFMGFHVPTCYDQEYFRDLISQFVTEPRVANYPLWLVVLDHAHRRSTKKEIISLLCV